MQQKRGQAAMEFLMTYGWAILAAIVAIGVLAYFGVFSPGKLAGSSAIVNNPFYANSWQVTTANVNLEMTNNGGDTLVVSLITVTGTGASASDDCTTGVISTTVNPGVQQLFAVACTGATMAAGESYAGNIQITYTKSGSTLTQTSTGTIRSTVQ
ncbi:MAG: hypothetical protein AABY16_04250 [Nanoarchaeota archaeon]